MSSTATEPAVAALVLGVSDDGFAHIDPLIGTDPATLAIPIGCPTAFPRPVAASGARRPR